MNVSPDKLPQLSLPSGFAFSAVSAGIKASGRLDLALVECARGAHAAALFTNNRVVAAPVQLGRSWLKVNRGRIRALLVNSGNANCATGKPGIAAVTVICRAAGKLLKAAPEAVFPSSTGIIGVPLPTEKILRKLEELIGSRRDTVAAANAFAEAILTTDARPKFASGTFQFSGKRVNLLGIAKGSGMIHPQLATMLVYLFTDISASSGQLRGLLRDACSETFNCISVDGDTSTNDTVLLMSSGSSGVRLQKGSVTEVFRAALLDVCHSLAQQIVSDGEGIQRVICLRIERARTRSEALRVARSIAHSPLVKTAWAGADPNWGRMLAAIGNAGIPLDPQRINIFIGDHQVCRNGQYCSFDERAAHRYLLNAQCDVTVELGRGRAAAAFYTTDLTAEYVRINADYST